MRQNIPSGHCRLWKKPPIWLQQARKKDLLLWVFATFTGIKSTSAVLGQHIEAGLVLSISRNENGWCLGKWGTSHASQGCTGASETDLSLRLGNRSKNLSDEVSCSGRPLGCPVYSLRATWSHTVVNAFLAGLRGHLGHYPSSKVLLSKSLNSPFPFHVSFDLPGLLRPIWTLRRGYPDSAKEMRLLSTTEGSDICGGAEDGWKGTLGAGARGP